MLMMLKETSPFGAFGLSCPSQARLDGTVDVVVVPGVVLVEVVVVAIGPVALRRRQADNTTSSDPRPGTILRTNRCLRRFVRRHLC